MKSSLAEAEVTEVTVAQAEQPEQKEPRDKLKRIVKALKAKCQLWHDADGGAYASFVEGCTVQHWAIESKGFREWVAKTAYCGKLGALSGDLIRDVCANLSGAAKFGGDEFSVATRVAVADGAYFISLGDAIWSSIKVSGKGWRPYQEPPVKFVRNSHTRPLPNPVEGGSLDLLWELTNIPEKDRLLVLAWMLECFRPDTPYPVLEITGEQGSAKSTTQEVLRTFIDPNRVMLRARPKTIEDVYVAAANSHLVSYENLSQLNPDMSDALCVVSTGGGFAARTLYTNNEETVLNAHNPVVLNGINKVVTRPDLVDRVISIDLPVIKNRIDELEHRRKLAESAPLIFGALLDLFSKTLKELPAVSIPHDKLPRMSDFTKLGEAMSRVLGNPPDTFLNLYIERRKECVLNILDASLVGRAIQSFVIGHGLSYVGTVYDLLGRLDGLTSKPEENEFWPKSPRALGGEMRRLAPALRQIGIKCEVLNRRRDGVWCEVGKN